MEWDREPPAAEGPEERRQAESRPWIQLEAGEREEHQRRADAAGEHQPRARRAPLVFGHPECRWQTPFRPSSVRLHDGTV
jgi:hypothetical protein